MKLAQNKDMELVDAWLLKWSAFLFGMQLVHTP